MNNITTIEQSRELIRLGLDPGTSDSYHWEAEGKDYVYFGKCQDPNGIPSWTLGRLIELINENDQVISLIIKKKSISISVKGNISKKIINPGSLMDSIYEIVVWLWNID